jgi:hypothetical protein
VNRICAIRVIILATIVCTPLVSAYADSLIVPGERVGSVRIGMSSSEVKETFGDPTNSSSDFYYIYTSSSSSNFLAIFFDTENNNVDQIVFTSSSFKTNGEISTGNVTPEFFEECDYYVTYRNSPDELDMTKIEHRDGGLAFLYDTSPTVGNRLPEPDESVFGVVYRTKEIPHDPVKYLADIDVSWYLAEKAQGAESEIASKPGTEQGMGTKNNEALEGLSSGATEGGDATFNDSTSAATALELDNVQSEEPVENSASAEQTVVASDSTTTEAPLGNETLEEEQAAVSELSDSDGEEAMPASFSSTEDAPTISGMGLISFVMVLVLVVLTVLLVFWLSKIIANVLIVLACFGVAGSVFIQRGLFGNDLVMLLVSVAAGAITGFMLLPLLPFSSFGRLGTRRKSAETATEET